MHDWEKLGMGCRLLGVLLGASAFFVGCQSVIADEISGEKTQALMPVQPSVSSPNGALEFRVTSEAGIPRYTIMKGEEVVVDASRLGLRFANGANLDDDIEITSIESSQHSETWEQPWGERRFIDDAHNELLVNFKTKDTQSEFGVRIRVFDDGVGFRYEVPDTGKRVIVDELTEFSVDPDATAWWTPAGEFNRYEYIYKTTPVRDLEGAHTPFTLRVPETNTHIAIHEAALVDYSGMWLDQRRSGILEADLAPRHDGTKVHVEGAFNTPWRVIQVSDDAEGLVNGSDIYLNLNEPNKLGDVSYFKPGKYIGIWWGMHIGKYTWGSGPIHGATTENTKQYIDFAAENGFSGVLVEGWNTGWDGDWFHNGDLFSFTESYEDFDLEELTEYARKRGVHIIGHHETSGSISNYEDQLEDAFDLYERVGVPAVKTGYVADGSDLKYVDEDGNARYTWHASQERVNHDLHVLKRAHEHKIAINAHEPVKDTGLRRTYPNAISREGARGMEFNAWGTPPNPPEHQAILPFTRMLSGPFDFTPGIFDLAPNGEDDQNKVPSTLAKQLALYVTVYSPIQMAADLPENYEKHPEAFQFIKDVPTDWDESIALDGEVGDFIVMARKERGSEDWFLGAVSDEEKRNVQLTFEFLDADRAYRADIYRDGSEADWEKNPYDITIEQRVISADSVIGLNLAAGGGAAFRITPMEEAAEKIIDVPAMKKVVFDNMGSDEISSRKVTVVLPADYDSQDRHYPVLYMHDGNNTLESGATITGDGWKVHEAFAQLIAEEKTEPAILVAIDNSSERWREYAPQKFVSKLNLQDSNGSEAVISDAYLSFIVEKVKPRIDAEFRTLSDKDNTKIMGSSMGGLISLYAVSEYPEVFGGAACLSTHWPLVISHEMASSTSREETIKAIQSSLSDGGIDPTEHRFWFDRGTLNLDAFYPEYQDSMDEYFKAQGFGEGNFETRVYEGADHNEASWASRIEDPLLFLFGLENK